MDATIPTGVISLLFTDVGGSTRLWESDPDGMAASLALHDQTMRSVIETRRGHVFSTAGDAFAVAFASVGAAVAAATAIQLELLEADWPGPPIKTRMGIHTGGAGLGEIEAGRLFAEGAKLDLDGALERGRRLLVDLSANSEPNSKEVGA